MAEPAPAYEPVDAIASGYRESQILLTAVRLGLFAALAAGERSAEELAAALAADPRGVRILADALAAMGLLEKEGSRYRNAAVAREHLLPDAPASKVPLLLHTAKLYARWAGLYDAVTGGRPVADEELDPRLLGEAGDFARAMGVLGRESAARVAAALDLTGVGTLLDLGGGPGLYAIELARREPDLWATVVDADPDTLAVARANVRQAGLGERITLRAGDALTDDLGGPYDLALVSNLVHIFSAAENRRLVARAAAALAPGGRLAIKDFLLDAGRTSPRGGAVFAVNMLVSTAGGDCYTVGEVGGWLAAAGLAVERVTELTAQSRLLVARREDGG